MYDDSQRKTHTRRGANRPASSALVDACRLLCQSSQDPAVVFDSSARCVAANAAAASLLGYDEAEFASLVLTDVLLDSGWRPGDGSHHVDGGEGWSGVATVRRKSGDLITVNAWVTTLADAADGALVLLLRPARDAPQHSSSHPPKAAWRAAELSDREIPGLPAWTRAPAGSSRDALLGHLAGDTPFRAAFAAASIGMALVMTDGSFLIVNPALCAMLDYDELALLQLSFPGVTHPEDLESDAELARQLLASEIESYQVEKRFIRQDAETIWGRLTVALVRDRDNSSLYFVAQVQDITPYKAFGAALREAEARYRTLVEQIPAVLYVDAPDSLGVPTYVSPQIEPLLGFTPDEWLASPGQWVERIHPSDREAVSAAVTVANETGESVQVEYRYIARDGTIVWVRDQPALVRDETGARRYWQGFMVDITARKQVEQDLRSALTAAEEANRLKSAFLSMATHELRTPLTVISGYVELLAAASAQLSAEEQEFVDIVRTSAATLTALVNDLLDLARIEAGRLELMIGPVNVVEAVERVCRMVAAQAAAKGIDVQIETPPKLPPIAADLNRLVQVLLNLFGNAIKFTEQGHVRCVVRARGNGVELRVIDTGIGIATEALPRIFDEFRQADAGTTRKFGGSGLGLAIAKRLIELQGGAISASSKLGVGSIFTIWLPAAPAQFLYEEPGPETSGVAMPAVVKDSIPAPARPRRRAASSRA